MRLAGILAASALSPSALFGATRSDYLDIVDKDIKNLGNTYDNIKIQKLLDKDDDGLSPLNINQLNINEFSFDKNLRIYGIILPSFMRERKYSMIISTEEKGEK